ncbi:MAG: 2OG-Fe(II) oxygenase family protein [Haliea sp.]|uniref:2OG-Fe(II) oxygenase family protein n=1 Tax=Haliea sp. TaxID=1932666 RepID=UPI0032ED7CF2
MPAPAVPVIDLRARRDAVAAQLAAAAASWGFFQVTGHGIAPALVAQTQATARAFFASDPALKQAVSRTLDNPFGYYDRELTKNLRDRKEIFDFSPRGETPWPPGMPALQPALQAFADACHALALELVELLCEGLALAPASLAAHFVPGHSSFLRLNHYPTEDLPLPADAPPPSPFGISHHTDAGALTVLLQDQVPGLQVQHDDAWLDVSPVPGALTINVGDMLQVWSNDRYVAPLHRVRASTDRARLSIAWFLNPGYDSVIEPLPGLLSSDATAHFRPLPWQEFRGLRALGDYGDYGEEVQISDYRQ